MVGHMIKKSVSNLPLSEMFDEVVEDSQVNYHQVIERLQARYGNIYRQDNVMISATHTHAGPGGYLQYLLVNIPCGGFVYQSYHAIVTGIVKVLRLCSLFASLILEFHDDFQSIQQAHGKIQRARVFLNIGELHGASVNRSPLSYLQNPEDERKRYKTNVDEQVVQLSIFSAESNQAIGIINWFPVHPTSMNSSNTLISGDNKGAASLMMEQTFNGKETLLGRGPFVAAFASSNLGDVSPNVKGPRCQKSGLPCHPVTSTCQDSSDLCIATGPGHDMFESTWMIGNRQYLKSLELVKDSANAIELHGPVRSVHQWVDMSNLTLMTANGDSVRTCSPALGYSFGAGTTDSPGEPGFVQVRS